MLKQAELNKMKDLRNTDHGFNQDIGVVITELGEGRAMGEIKITDGHRNYVGSVHGGVLFTLADTIGGAAALTEGNRLTTVNGDIHYLSPALAVEKIVATAQVIKSGKTISVVEVKITDEKGKLLTTSTMTYYNLRIPFFNEEGTK